MTTAGDVSTIRKQARAWAVVLAGGLGVWVWACWLEAAAVPSPRFRLLAIFTATILGLMVPPLPGGAMVLLGLLATVLLEVLSLRQALQAYANPNVWLVLAAFMLSRAFVKTGLARRIALTFIRWLGKTTLGLSYALVAADAVLAAMIPSNGARVGGVMLPITRSLAELYRSHPGPTAGLIGSFLMLTLYQADVMACSLFLTGQTGNLVALEWGGRVSEAETGAAVPMNYRTWTLNALVPALACLLLIPLLIYRWVRPGITHTPDAADFARRELLALGRPDRAEWLTIGVFLTVCTLWICLPGQDAALVAIGGMCALLVLGVLSWEDVISERAGWDVFIWYGGLVLLGNQLNELGLTDDFARLTVGYVVGYHWLTMFVVLLVVYFYAHYGFAGITTHLSSLYPAFAAVLIKAGAPAPLAIWSLAYVANFSAGSDQLRHYPRAAGLWHRLRLHPRLVGRGAGVVGRQPDRLADPGAALVAAAGLVVSVRSD
jgi:DASS family divalent anion:Na+ symporter